MGQKLANNAFSTLNSDISASDTTIVLASGHGNRFPSLSAGEYFYATLDDLANNIEIVKVTARVNDTLTVVRGQDGTTAKAYQAGTVFELRPTRVLFQAAMQEASVAIPLSGTNNYTGTLSPVPQAYETNQIYWFIFSGTNTSSSPTVNLSELGVVDLRRRDGSQFLSGEIPVGVALPFSYTGSQFRAVFTSFAYLRDGSLGITGSLNQPWLATSGTSTAYTITPTSLPSGYAAGHSYLVQFHVTCGSNPTLQIGNLADPPNLVKRNPGGAFSNLAVGDVVAGWRSRVVLLSAAQALVEELPRVDAYNAVFQGAVTQAPLTTDGTSTAYTLSPTDALGAYAAGVSYYVRFHVTCGANPTLQVSGLPSPPNLVKRNPDGTLSNLASGDVTADWRSRVTFVSATQALVENLPRVNAYNAAFHGAITQAPLTTGGSSTAYTLAPTDVLSAYAAGVSYYVQFHTACGASPTLQISGLSSPPNLVKRNIDGTLSNLAANDIPTNWRSRVTLLSATQALVEDLPVDHSLYYRLSGVSKITGSLNESVLTTGGTSTAYTLTPTSALSAYAAGHSYLVQFHVACGANPTLQISGLSSPPNLVKRNPDGTVSNLAANDITANWSSRVVLLSATQALVKELPRVNAYNTTFQGTVTQAPLTTGGTSTAYTLTPADALAAYTAGVSYYVHFHVSCGANPTIQISGLASPPNLVKRYHDGTFGNLAAGDVPAGWRSRVTLISATQALVEEIQSPEPFALPSSHPTVPDWRTNPNSQIANWAQFSKSLNLLVSNTRKHGLLTCMPEDKGSYPGSNAFRGAVLLLDGRVFCVPYNSTTARIYNPFTDTLTTPSGTYPGSDAFVGGVLLSDGRVFCVPFNSTTARIYNPLTNTLTTPSGTYPGSQAFEGGVLLADGRVFMVPRNSTTARIYDPASDTLTTPSGTYPGSLAFVGGVLLPDGRVFCVPFNNTTALIYDPATDTLTTPSGTYPGSGAFARGVLLADGRVFCVPYMSAAARIYDPVTDTLTTPSGTYPGTADGFYGGVLLPDGRVFVVPYYNSTARIYDPVTDTLTTPPGSYDGGGNFVGGCLLPDGRVFLVPNHATTGAITTGTPFIRVPSGIATSPFFNKF